MDGKRVATVGTKRERCSRNLEGTETHKPWLCCLRTKAAGRAQENAIGNENAVSDTVACGLCKPVEHLAKQPFVSKIVWDDPGSGGVQDTATAALALCGPFGAVESSSKPHTLGGERDQEEGTTSCNTMLRVQ